MTGQDDLLALAGVDRAAWRSAFDQSQDAETRHRIRLAEIVLAPRLAHLGWVRREENRLGSI